MIEKFRKTVPFDKFSKAGLNFKASENKTYYISYTEFLNYFKNTTEITKHNLIIGINFVYGWMPTIFDFCTNNFDDALTILNSAKQGNIPSVKELEILKSLLNNSLVGTSKLLHFINPNKFAIWDSKVYYYLTGNVAHHNRIGKCESYLAYLKFCNELTQRKEYDEVHERICHEVRYPMSRLRTAELIMFSTKDTKSNEEQ